MICIVSSIWLLHVMIVMTFYVRFEFLMYMQNFVYFNKKTYNLVYDCVRSREFELINLLIVHVLVVRVSRFNFVQFESEASFLTWFLFCVRS